MFIKKSGVFVRLKTFLKHHFDRQNDDEGGLLSGKFHPKMYHAAVVVAALAFVKLNDFGFPNEQQIIF